MSQFIKIPIVRIQKDQLLIYETFANGNPRSEKQKVNEENLTRGKYNGFMSSKTKSKIKKELSTWINSVNTIRRQPVKEKLDKIPYFTFITLTLSASQEHSDNTIKRKLLTPYIATLQRRFNVWNYFWRAEPQKNGNIHFHLIVDSYIPWADIRESWNNQLNKLQYIDRFEEKHGHRNPNSTDIHKVQHVQDLAGYLCKYITKMDTTRAIEGRIHGCSDDIRGLQPYQDVMIGKLDTFVRKVMEDETADVRVEEDYTIIKCNVNDMIKKYYPRLAREIIEYHHAIAVRLYSIQLPDYVVEIMQKKERKRLIQLEMFG
jgi:hypothetical protein